MLATFGVALVCGTAAELTALAGVVTVAEEVLASAALVVGISALRQVELIDLL